MAKGNEEYVEDDYEDESSEGEDDSQEEGSEESEEQGNDVSVKHVDHAVEDEVADDTEDQEQHPFSSQVIKDEEADVHFKTTQQPSIVVGVKRSAVDEVEAEAKSKVKASSNVKRNKTVTFAETEVEAKASANVKRNKTVTFDEAEAESKASANMKRNKTVTLDEVEAEASVNVKRNKTVTFDEAEAEAEVSTNVKRNKTATFDETEASTNVKRNKTVTLDEAEAEAKASDNVKRNKAVTLATDEEDEITLLQGMLDYLQKEKSNAISTTDEFMAFIKRLIQFDVTKPQLIAIKKLKAMFNSNANRSECKSGKEKYDEMGKCGSDDGGLFKYQNIDTRVLIEGIHKLESKMQMDFVNDCQEIAEAELLLQARKHHLMAKKFDMLAAIQNPSLNL